MKTLAQAVQCLLGTCRRSLNAHGNVMKRVAVLSTFLLLPTVGAASAQVNSGSEPSTEATASSSTDQSLEEAMGKMVSAMGAGDWDAFAELMHPEALEEFHRSFSSAATHEEMKELVSVFFEVEDSEGLALLSPQEAFARFMRSMIAQQPSFGQLLAGSEATYLGSVEEGDLVHAVYRLSMTASGVGLSQVSTAPFKYDGTRWRALLSGPMEQMIEVILAELPEEAPAAPEDESGEGTAGGDQG